MKLFRRLLLILLIIPCFLLSGCSFFSSKIYVTNIEESGTTGNLTNYTITYSNGTTSTLAVKNGLDGSNGIDGEDGQNLTLDLLKDYSQEQGYDDFNKFLKDYFDIDYITDPIKTASNIALQSVVSIYCEFPSSSNLYCGAGVIYKMEDNASSYIITNNHVVSLGEERPYNIKLFQYGTNEYIYKTNELNEYNHPKRAFGEGAVDATFIGGSESYDIAVLKVNTNDLLKNNATAAPVTVASDYHVAETAIAIGNPKGYGLSVTSGIISVESEYTTYSDNSSIDHRVMRIDTAVNGGNSGGGLFNAKGELIGIVNAKIQSVDIDNMAYALPYDNVTKVADNILYYYNETTNPVASVKIFNIGNVTCEVVNSKSTYDKETNTVNITDNLKIIEIEENCLAEDFGFMVNDIITSVIINGTTYSADRYFEIIDLMITIRAGDTVEFNIIRGNSTAKLSIKNYTVTEDDLLIKD